MSLVGFDPARPRRIALDGNAGPDTRSRAATAPAGRRATVMPLQMARDRSLARRAGLALADAPNAAPGDAATVADDTLDTAFAIGWDHARHDLVPPLERLCINPQLQQGYRAGRAAFGRRTLPPSAAVRRWLELRLRALAAGRAYESVQLTPHYLRQLETAHCPVTRERLTSGDGIAPTDAQIERVRDDAGYAAGHLAVMSVRAAVAKDRLDLPAVRARWQAARALRNGPARPGGLSASQWGRLALLASYVTPLPHDEAAALPMLLLPPNRLRMFNPVQALQAVITHALAHETPNRRLAAIRGAVPAAQHGDVDAFLVALRAAFEQQAASRPGGPARWALEDAWDDRRVLARWKRLARALTAADCEAIVTRCGGDATACLPAALATEGWALESGGYLRPRGPAPADRGRRRAGVAGETGVEPLADAGTRDAAAQGRASGHVAFDRSAGEGARCGQRALFSTDGQATPAP